MRIRDSSILDDEGRYLILRGVNLGGDSKIPFCAPGDETSPDFLNRKNKVSFIGRPFPLEEAEDHFKRLKKAGMTFLRFIVTWEAIEHEAPGIYDEAYLAYLRKILLIAEKEGIDVFIDPHQDVWSRWTGGDGAPAWTMEKLGMNLDVCDDCGAAVTRQRYSLNHGKPYPKMLWPSNYNRYAALTMFSLFYAGKTFAPNVLIEGENAEDWLQNRYIAAFKHAQRRLKNCNAIKGWGVMNEPYQGLIGHQDLEKVEDYVIPNGPRPSPWQAIRAASGYRTEVPVYRAIGKRVIRCEIFNEKQISLFNSGFTCPWKSAGVWTDEGGAPKLLKKDHFANYNGRRPDFADDFLKPFSVKYINALKEAEEAKNNFFFIEGLPNARKAESHPSWKSEDPSNVVDAFHWYDGLSLFTKSFRPWFNADPNTVEIKIGEKNVRAFFKKCLAEALNIVKVKLGNIPSLLGEFGLAFDLNNKKAYKTGDYSLHEKALSMNYDAVDANLMHSTLWNYTASNTNKYGDSWNDEDLSIFSEGKERATAGWKRPYPMATAGKPVSFSWNYKRKEFTYIFTADASIKAPTIIYLPQEFFGISPKIETSLRCEYKSEEQLLFVYNDTHNGETVLKIKAQH